jgi:hypothetical protein
MTLVACDFTSIFDNGTTEPLAFKLMAKSFFCALMVVMLTGGVGGAPAGAPAAGAFGAALVAGAAGPEAGVPLGVLLGVLLGATVGVAAFSPQATKETEQVRDSRAAEKIERMNELEFRNNRITLL